MSAYRNTTYPANRPSEKPADGWGKSMHGDSLKPGDVVYGPAVVEGDRNGVQVLNKHFGIVVTSESDKIGVMYTTSEKSFNLAHGQSLSAEDKALSSGFSKDGHWSRSDFYSIPPELVERRGYVSDATWDKVQLAAASAARSSNTVMPSMDREGQLHSTSGRAAGEWAGFNAAAREAVGERASMSTASTGPSAEDLAVRDAKVAAVGVVQELLKADGSEPSHRYSQSEAAGLADRIAEAPDGASVVMTPQDKLRVVTDGAGLAKCQDWERMSVGDAKELIQGEVDRVRTEFAAERDKLAAPESVQTTSEKPGAEQSAEKAVEAEGFSR